MNKRIVIVSIVFAIALSLRLYHLGFHDFWYDEIGTIGYAQYPWSNWNAPLYWILLHFWIKLFGISEFSLRFPSLIFSFLSVILVFFLGKSLFNRKIGIFASIFMGLSPFHLWYAQEARDYSMILFLGLLSSYFLYKALKDRQTGFWLFFILASIAGLYTNYFFIFLFTAQLLYIIVFLRPLRISIKHITAFLIIGLGFLPYLSRFLNKFFYIWGHFWIPQPSINSLAITVENFILGYNTSIIFYIIADVLAIIFFAIAIAKLRKRELKSEIFLCLFFFLVPIISAFLFSRIFFSVYLDRGLIIFSPYLYLILSLGIVSIEKRYLKISILVVLFSLLFISDYGYYKDWMPTSVAHHTGTYIKKPIKPLVRFIENNLDSDDILAFSNPSAMPSVRFYSKEKIPFYYFFDPQILDSSWKRPIQESKFYIPFYKINNLKFRRLWFVASNWARDGKLDGNSRAVKAWLDKNLKLKSAREFDGLWVFRYGKHTQSEKD